MTVTTDRELLGGKRDMDRGVLERGCRGVEGLVGLDVGFLKAVRWTTKCQGRRLGREKIKIT